MSHARRHEKKLYIECLTKLCNKGLSKKQRSKLEKQSEKHLIKFHEYADKWNHDNHHKLDRRRKLHENEVLINVFSEIWLLFSKYIVSGKLSKEGYYSLKKRLHYAMVPLRGSEVLLLEEKCIDADWDVDSRIFSNNELDHDHKHIGINHENFY